MKIRPLLILIEFGLISVPLAWWWTHGGLDSYYEIFKRLAFPLLQELGVESIRAGLVRDRLAGYIPFLVLMVVTPQMSIKRRLGGLGLGFLAIFFAHVALGYWSWVCFIRDGESVESMARYFPALILTDAVPFVAWAIAANKFLLDRLKRVLPAPDGSSEIQSNAKGSAPPPQSSPSAERRGAEGGATRGDGGADG
ncbi:MAG TPA: hypothetical protein EYQ54_00780 [Myxococcales bacterium]|nr:hypothetical protein [Myxococcales bacterium]